MAKTNGYNRTVVLQALNRLGFKSTDQREYDDLVDCDNQASASGLFYNDDSFHTAVSIQNIYECQPDFKLDADGFNKYLLQLKQSVALSALNQVFDAPQFLDSGLLFRRIDQTRLEALNNSNKFCFVKIQPSPDGDFGVALNNVVLLFDGTTPFDLYLFHSMHDGQDKVGNSMVDVPYIKKWRVTPKANRQVVFPLDYDINYSNDIIKGGDWFLGYFQSQLGSMRALRYSSYRNRYRVFTSTCGTVDANNGNTDFDRSVHSTSDDMIGLNLEVSSYIDRTQTIINSAHLFDNLQGLMMAAKVIELIVNTTRSNVIQRITRENMNSLMLQLKGYKSEERFIPGIEHRIMSEVKRLRKAFQRSGTATNVDIC